MEDLRTKKVRLFIDGELVAESLPVSVTTSSEACDPKPVYSVCDVPRLILDWVRFKVFMWRIHRQIRKSFNDPTKTIIDATKNDKTEE